MDYLANAHRHRLSDDLRYQLTEVVEGYIGRCERRGGPQIVQLRNLIPEGIGRMTAQHFYIAISNPKPGDDVGQVEEGWYIVKRGTVILTDRNGTPLGSAMRSRPLGRCYSRA